MGGGQKMVRVGLEGISSFPLVLPVHYYAFYLIFNEVPTVLHQQSHAMKLTPAKFYVSTNIKGIIKTISMDINVC